MADLDGGPMGELMLDLMGANEGVQPSSLKVIKELSNGLGSRHPRLKLLSEANDPLLLAVFDAGEAESVGGMLIQRRFIQNLLPGPLGLFYVLLAHVDGGGVLVTTDNKGGDAGAHEVAEWLSGSAEELAELIAGPEREKEEIFQAWLERHPAFVPGALGPNGMSGHEPWPMALITQPKLSGLGGKIPDFCWLAADSAHLTAVLVEIETPAKTWQHSGDAGQSAELTQAIEQLNSWRAWFAQPDRAAGFLREYRLPSHYCDLTFTQHYVLIHGSRAEFEGNRVREGQRAAGMAAPDAVFMSFDRLLEIAPARAARYGCVRIDENGYHAVAVPPIWTPSVLDGDALRASSGYEYVLEAGGVPPDRAGRFAEEIVSRQAAVAPRFRYRPPGS